MKTIAISIGDLNGVGLEIALRAHEEVKKLCHPIYCISESMLLQGAKKLNLPLPHDFITTPCMKAFEIEPGKPSKGSGLASFASFQKALQLAKIGYANALVTLPINKEAWSMAGIPYKGHTDALADILGEDAIMMLGCDEMFVALYTHHIPLKDIPSKIEQNRLTQFLLDFHKGVSAKTIGVLALNPHAGDGGVIGDEEKIISKAIDEANAKLGKDIFTPPLVPDVAFSAERRAKIKHFACMYHDQGLIPLKALYFEDSINVSLNLSVLRTSVDHGTAYDKAYKNQKLSLKSYLNAVKYAIISSKDDT